MFLSHFRLNSDPFADALDPAFFYPGPDHREAVAELYRVMQRRGCGMLLGEKGMGKTLILRYLRKLIGPCADTVILSAPMDGTELLEAICRGFGVSPNLSGWYPRLAALEELFAEKARKDRRAVLIIDDADQLSADALELLQIASAFETAGQKPVDILLAGRPTLVRTLSIRALEHLKLSIEVSCKIAPFDAARTAQYVSHRLMIAGAHHSLFTSRASSLLAEFTRGVPRRINQLGHQTLVRAWSHGFDRVDEDIVREAIDELPHRLSCRPAFSTAGAEE